MYLVYTLHVMVYAGTYWDDCEICAIDVCLDDIDPESFP